MSLSLNPSLNPSIAWSSPATWPPSLMIWNIWSSSTSCIFVQSVRSPGLVTSVAAAGPSPFADAPWHLTHRESNLFFAAAKSSAMHGADGDRIVERPRSSGLPL